MGIDVVNLWGGPHRGQTSVEEISKTKTAP